MNSRSPTREGFRAIFCRPSLGFAEIAWRWSFGAAASLLMVLSCVEYLDILPVTHTDLVLLRSRQPVLIGKAIGNLVQGSGPRVLEVFLILALALVAGWIVMAALGRAATLDDIVHHFREQDGAGKILVILPMIGLTFLRATVTAAAVFAGFAAFALFGRASTPDETGIVFELVIVVFGLVWVVWSMLNWFLSLAAIFVVAKGRGTFGAIADTVGFFHRRSGQIFAVGTAFGLAHLAVWLVAGIAAAFPLGLAAALPGRVVLTALIVITLLYFAAADFLYVGRLAAYVAILELPEAPPVRSPQPSGNVDPYELILSDVPLPG